MRPELSVPRPFVRVAAAMALALGAVLLLGFVILFIWQTIVPSGSEKQRAYTEQEKLNILAGLSGTTSLSKGERVQMLKDLSGKEEVSEQEKEAILKALQNK